MTSLLCAVCAERPATHPDRIDGRVYQVCLRCRGDEVLPDASGRPKDARLLLEDVVAVVARAPGATSYEVAAWLGLAETDRQRQRVYAALHRLVKLRQIEPITDRRHVPQRYQVVAGAGSLLRLRPEQAPATRLAAGLPALLPPPAPPRRTRAAEPGRPPLMRDRVLTALRRSPGVELFELAEGLGLTSEAERNHVNVVLTRLIRAGLARCDGKRGSRSYYPVDEAAKAAA